MSISLLIKQLQILQQRLHVGTNSLHEKEEKSPNKFDCVK